MLNLATAVFVLAEFSLTALEKAEIIAQLDKKNDFKTRAVLKAHQTLSIQLSSAQVGITLTTLISGMLAYPVFKFPLHFMVSKLFGISNPSETILIIIALIFTTIISMEFGELLPKNIAISYPLLTAQYTVLFILFFSKIFKWVIYFINNCAAGVLRIFHIRIKNNLNSARNINELENIVNYAAQQGDIDVQTASMIDNSLGFGKLTAEELMTPRTKVVTLEKNDTVFTLIQKAIDTGFSRFPVVEKDLDECVGVVHIKQVFSLSDIQKSQIKLHTIVSSVLSVPASLDGDSLMTRIKSDGNQFALVIDEYGSTAGIVTMEDLVEEIVGDVQDEHDKEQDQILKSTNGWICSGLLRIGEVADLTGINLLPGEYDTLGGMVMTIGGKIPSIGEYIILPLAPKLYSSENKENMNSKNEVVAQILNMDRLRVDRVQLIL